MSTRTTNVFLPHIPQNQIFLRHPHGFENFCHKISLPPNHFSTDVPREINCFAPVVLTASKLYFPLPASEKIFLTGIPVPNPNS